MMLFLLLQLLLGELLTLVGVVKGQEELCHPKCDCLDSYFYCRKGLQEFPPDFPEFVQILNVSNNEINTIPGNSLERLVALHTLVIDGNNLTTFPNPGKELPFLTLLSLSRNGISSIEADVLKKFPALKELDLDRNGLKEIKQSSFPENWSLKILSLSNNEIEFLGEGCFQNLPFLEDLNLSRNKLKSIPKSLFSGSSNLEHLDLSRNRLDVLESLRFQDLGGLGTLSLRKNAIRNLSDAAFYGLDKLEQLFLDGNRITFVEKRWLYGLRNLKLFNLSSNAVKEIEDKCFEGMDNLNFLDLSDNHLIALKKSGFEGLRNLRHLYISGNQISFLGTEVFLPLHNVEHLDLSKNHLSWILEETGKLFTGLADCKHLSLAGNKLRTLHSEALKGLDASLRVLDISSNPIKFLEPTTFISFPTVEILLENVTTLVCDCGATWLHTRLNTYQHHISTKKGKNRGRGHSYATTPSSIIRTKNLWPTCGSPKSMLGIVLTDLPLLNFTCSDEMSRPLFTSLSKSQTFLKEEHGNLFCVAQSHSDSKPTVMWLKDSQPLLETRNIKNPLPSVNNFEHVEEPSTIINSSLSFSNVTWHDAGIYQCLSENEYGVSYSPKMNISVHIFPSFVKRPANITVRLGGVAKLECGVSGFPPPEILFQKDGGDFFAALDRRFHVLPNDDYFMILDVRLADMGMYCCLAHNSEGEVRACATVTVFETPSFLSPMKDEKVVAGTSTVLECTGIGSPNPTVMWSKENVLIHSGETTSRIRLKGEGSLLVIKDVQQSDAGKYECILSNAVGTARDFLVLTVIPNTGTDLSHWPWSIIVVILVIVALCCVVSAMFVAFLVIFRSRKDSAHQYPDLSLLPKQETYNDRDLHPIESLGESPKQNGECITQNGLLPEHKRDKGLFPDVASEFSYKDSGTGDDLPFEVDSNSINPEQESLIVNYWRNKPDAEVAFSTFGWTSDRSQLNNHSRNASSASVNLNIVEGSRSIISELEERGDIIHIPLSGISRGGQRGTLPGSKKVLIPVPPGKVLASVGKPATASNISHTPTPAVSELSDEPAPIETQINCNQLQHSESNEKRFDEQKISPNIESQNIPIVPSNYEIHKSIGKIAERMDNENEGPEIESQLVRGCITTAV